MKLLVIIVTYNGHQWIDKCLGSLRTSTIRPDVYIVDNGSSDGTQEYIKLNYSEVMFHQSNENLGFGRANNMGLQYALDNGYEYVYLLNQDAWVFPNTFELLINAFETNPDFGILSPIQMQANESYLDESFKKCISVSHYVDSLYNNAILGINLNHPYEVGMTMAAHWMISKNCLKTVGGFSPTFPHYGEDVNYNDRIHYWKFKMGIVPAAKAIHDREKRSDSIKKLLHMYKMTELSYLSNPISHHKPWIIYYLQHVFMFITKYNTLSYLSVFGNIICQLKSIKRNKMLSKDVCAFLTLNSKI